MLKIITVEAVFAHFLLIISFSASPDGTYARPAARNASSDISHSADEKRFGARQRRSTNVDPRYSPWNDESGSNIVRYDMAPEYTGEELLAIRLAMNNIQTQLGGCVAFQRYSPTADTGRPYVLFTPLSPDAVDRGLCYTQPGRDIALSASSGPQTVVISQKQPSGCSTNVRRIMHTLANLLGLCNQYQRPDRDLYLKIDMEAVDRQFLFSPYFTGTPYDKYERNKDIAMFYGYDYCSITQVPANFLAKSSEVNVFSVLQPSVTLPNDDATQLSANDCLSLTALYQCRTQMSMCSALQNCVLPTPLHSFAYNSHDGNYHSDNDDYDSSTTSDDRSTNHDDSSDRTYNSYDNYKNSYNNNKESYGHKIYGDSRNDNKYKYHKNYDHSSYNGHKSAGYGSHNSDTYKTSAYGVHPRDASDYKASSHGASYKSHDKSYHNDNQHDDYGLQRASYGNGGYNSGRYKSNKYSDNYDHNNNYGRKKLYGKYGYGYTSRGYHRKAGYGNDKSYYDKSASYGSSYGGYGGGIRYQRHSSHDDDYSKNKYHKNSYNKDHHSKSSYGHKSSSYDYLANKYHDDCKQRYHKKPLYGYHDDYRKFPSYDSNLHGKYSTDCKYYYDHSDHKSAYGSRKRHSSHGHRRHYNNNSRKTSDYPGGNYDNSNDKRAYDDDDRRRGERYGDFTTTVSLSTITPITTPTPIATNTPTPTPTPTTTPVTTPVTTTTTTATTQAPSFMYQTRTKAPYRPDLLSYFTAKNGAIPPAIRSSASFDECQPINPSYIVDASSRPNICCQTFDIDEAVQAAGGSIYLFSDKYYYAVDSNRPRAKVLHGPNLISDTFSGVVPPVKRAFTNSDFLTHIIGSDGVDRIFSDTAVVSAVDGTVSMPPENSYIISSDKSTITFGICSKSVSEAFGSASNGVLGGFTSVHVITPLISKQKEQLTMVFGADKFGQKIIGTYRACDVNIDNACSLCFMPIDGPVVNSDRFDFEPGGC